MSVRKLLSVGVENSKVIGWATRCGFEAVNANGFREAIECLHNQRFEIVLVDLEPLGHGGFLLLDELAQAHCEATVVVMAKDESLTLRQARTSTAAILLQKPVQESLLLRLIEHFSKLGTDHSMVRSQSLVGISTAMHNLRERVTLLKNWQHSVLICGETGTGKELVAHAFHAATGCNGSFVTVDCGAISPGLIENELFGHTKGAYTGAEKSQKGLVLEANGGTLFFDEIGDLPYECQSRLLRLLQEHEIRALGDTHAVPVKVRVCAATNVNLATAVREKRFREDLFYRLSAITLAVPPLRERREDISLLTHHFLQWSGIGKRFSLEALRRFHRYSWPGNVRELQNKILRVGALAEGEILSGDDVLDGPETAFPAVSGGTLAEVNKQVILRAVADNNNNVVEAARHLGIGKTTLYRKLKAYRS